MKKIVIEPVTRIEGHAKVSLFLDDKGEVNDARFQVMELRGFEKFLEGYRVEEMPRITPRICGVCPSAHHLASAKAVDDLFDVEIPETAKKIRELMYLGHMIHSHALSFFILAGPDFIMGPDSPSEERNVLGIAKKQPELAKKALKLRSNGQTINKLLGGQQIHPIVAVPGGVANLPDEKTLLKVRELAKESLDLAEFTLELGKGIFEKYNELIENLAVFETYFLGTLKNGCMNYYEGDLCIMDPEGNLIEKFKTQDYIEFIAERAEKWTYMKFPYYKKAGYENGTFRVNTLARINLTEKMETPRAQEELEIFRETYGRPAHATLLYHYARLIELLYASEKALELSSEDLNGEYRADIGEYKNVGIGHVEAPRGTLIHHYEIDEKGRIKGANIIVATQINNKAINQAILDASRKAISDGKVDENKLNLIEIAVRAHDPCLSCATHRIGRFCSEIEIFDHEGNLHYIKRYSKEVNNA
ncbi:MAG: Ni/Fe hydrogenase subunit alpha [Candidatus Hydrothermarchaeota archaeon]